MTAYQRAVIDREASRLHAASNREHGHPAPASVWPLVDDLHRFPWRCLVADALGIPTTWADWS